MSTTTHTITLNEGVQVPWLAFGTGTALYNRDAAELVRIAIDNGITHLDGAQMYNNEDSLGQGIKASNKPRSELFIVTKLKPGLEGQTVKQTLEESLQKLGLDHVDLFLIHSPTPANQEEGRLKELWKVEDLKEILDGAEIVPAVNQIELHPYVWKAAEPIVNFGKEHGIVTASYGGQTPIVRAPGGPVDEVLSGIREGLEKTRGQPVTSGQVLSKWLLHKGAIVVTTTSKVSRIQEFIDTERVPDLTQEELRDIEEAGAKLHKRIFMRHAFGE
ncbi:hypothetical protein H0H81_005666 [Sphagnurus paluster]|uniref:NADP-dependent oxidoreductase domain-containing protein n=1 Tax=Sphagnurus paluster TaxID=117069 RepID=A0A9P7FYG9_9AGAR|nr:hypothetical protein H0H81_005666 [Sphagnurus paluster]